MSTDQARNSIGSCVDPKFIHARTYDADGIFMDQRIYLFDTESGLVSGVQSDVRFTLGQPPEKAWPIFSDFNLWQNSHGYFYPRTLAELYDDPTGDVGTETFKLGIKGEDGNISDWPDEYRVLRVIPGRGIVMHQTVPDDSHNGGVSPGFHVFLLQAGADGTSLATASMEHAIRHVDGSEAGALEFWRDQAPEAEKFWTQSFIPNLRKLVQDRVD